MAIIREYVERGYEYVDSDSVLAQNGIKIRKYEYLQYEYAKIGSNCVSSVGRGGAYL